MQLQNLAGYVLLLLAVVVLAFTLYAFVHAAMQRPDAYTAAGKLTKTTWCTILGIGVVLFFVPIPLILINLILLVAALVYLADVRPALAGLYRR